MLKITPQTVLLSGGQSATFVATDDQEKRVNATWELSAGIGQLPTPDPSPTAQVVYTAPFEAKEQTITLIARSQSDTANAVIALTPDAVRIAPSRSELEAGQAQDFLATVAGVGSSVDWLLSPPIGELDAKNGIYRAPPDVSSPGTVRVTVCNPATGVSASAVVALVPPKPWTGVGVQLLGAFLLLIFSLVYFLIALWPPALPSPDGARASRIEAERALDSRAAELQAAENAQADADDAVAEARTPGVGLSGGAAPPRDQPGAAPPRTGKPGNPAQPDDKREPAPPTPSGSALPVNGATTAEATPSLQARKAETQRRMAQLALERARTAHAASRRDLEDKLAMEKVVNDPNISTLLFNKINRELDLLALVLLGGALGAFLHMAQSYAEYIGNRKLKATWAWWYGLRPFIGSGLAIVFYATVRGGFMAITTGSGASASELNPFGVVAMAALVGMFSRNATIKLGEVFDTLFKSDAMKTRDKIDGAKPAPATAAGQTTAAKS